MPRTSCQASRRAGDAGLTLACADRVDQRLQRAERRRGRTVARRVPNGRGILRQPALDGIRPGGVPGGGFPRRFGGAHLQPGIRIGTEGVGHPVPHVRRHVLQSIEGRHADAPFRRRVERGRHERVEGVVAGARVGGVEERPQARRGRGREVAARCQRRSVRRQRASVAERFHHAEDRQPGIAVRGLVGRAQPVHRPGPDDGQARDGRLTAQVVARRQRRHERADFDGR